MMRIVVCVINVENYALNKLKRFLDFVRKDKITRRAVREVRRAR
jgi:hypothetical protein